MAGRIAVSGDLRLWGLLVVGAIVGCGGGGGGEPTGNASVAGTVTSVHTGAPVAGAVVQVGSKESTTDAAGAFSLAGLPDGSAAMSVTLQGFEAYSATVTLAAGANTVDVSLTRQASFSTGTYALYAPAGAAQLRGVVITMGGPNTRGFVTGEQMVDDPASLEVALQAFGAELRALAADSALAILGSSVNFVEDDAASDQALQSALTTLAGLSARPELANAPVVILGLGFGSSGAWGYAGRNAARVAGAGYLHPNLLRRAAAPARTTPSMFWVAENDDLNPPPQMMPIFTDNRAAGAIWGAGVHPGATRASLSSAERASMLAWLSAIMGVRLPATIGGPLRTANEDAGWLGNLTTTEITAHAGYAGDPLTAAWLPNEPSAQRWKVLVTP